MTFQRAPAIPIALLKNPVHLLSTGLGSGLSPVAPGTMGTLVAIPIYLGLQSLAPLLYLVVCLAMFLVGIGLCGATSRALRAHDHAGIVWDEIVGYLLTMVAVPRGWVWVVLGFVLFRLFDIWKPWPIRFFDRGVQGGLGIMLDDLLAALYASLVLQAALWLLQR